MKRAYFILVFQEIFKLLKKRAVYYDLQVEIVISKRGDDTRLNFNQKRSFGGIEKKFVYSESFGDWLPPKCYLGFSLSPNKKQRRTLKKQRKTL